MNKEDNDVRASYIHYYITPAWSEGFKILKSEARKGEEEDEGRGIEWDWKKEEQMEDGSGGWGGVL